MQRHTEQTLSRIGKYLERFIPLIHPQTVPLEAEVSGPHGRIPFAEAPKLRYQKAKAGLPLDPPWSTWWFRLSGTAPKSWGKNVDLLFNSYSEAQVWANGEPLQGLNFDSKHPFGDGGRLSCRVKPDANGRVKLMVEAAANGLFGIPMGRGYSNVDEGKTYQFEKAELAYFDQEAWDLYHELLVPVNFLLETAKKKNIQPWQGFLLAELNRLANEVVPEDKKTWPRARAILKKIYSHKNASYGAEISAIGHAHIDTAWLWPLAETIRKCARSFSTALAYMEEYPDYKFSCSQAQQYVWMKELYPTIYEGIKKAVKRGQWIPVGGTWIEPDCNIPSGESLVRQFLYGKRFFREAFGLDAKEFWNPDVFGYSGALPQIMKGAGIENFLTQKLSWNQFNKPHHQNFEWAGIDGTRVLTHFPPADTYNAMTGYRIIKDLCYHEENMTDHDRTKEAMLLFGYGDGGGGPTRHMLEVLKRVKDFQGIPRTVQRSSADFFKRLRSDLKDIPVIEGELYFELHRGTYTSQAANKRDNRKSEFLLREVEILASIASLSRKPGTRSAYPSAELDRLWKLVLLNQFHDILPGSSINEVYRDSAKHYADVLSNGKRLRTEFAEALGNDKKGTSVFNPSGWKRKGVVEIGKELAYVESPSLGMAPVDTGLIPDDAVHAEKSGNKLVLENKALRAEFSVSGDLVRLLEKKSGREALAPGETGNSFVLFDDQPNNWDAWDVDVFHLETRELIPGAANGKIIENKPLRAGLSFSRSFGASSIHQKVFLEAGSGHLVFECEVDWHHRKKFLKVEFPVDVKNDEATYEIQFGSVKRPTHFNTTHDLARFEVPAHKWIDLSEPGFGVSLFTDSKFGYAVHGNVMRISLLRAPLSPDPEADQGKHVFRYACYPHTGDHIAAETVRRAWEFNEPLVTIPGLSAKKSFFSVDSPHLVIDTVKKAEDSDALVVRLYECHGARGETVFHFPENFNKVFSANLLEEKEKEYKTGTRGERRLRFRPFEIVTLILES